MPEAPDALRGYCERRARARRIAAIAAAHVTMTTCPPCECATCEMSSGKERTVSGAWDASAAENTAAPKLQAERSGRPRHSTTSKTAVVATPRLIGYAALGIPRATKLA